MTSLYKEVVEPTQSRSQAAPGTFQLATERLTGVEYKHLQGKRVGLVAMSPYPYDPRPRRTADALLRQGMSVDYICVTHGKAPWHEKTNGIEVFRVPIACPKAHPIARHRGGKVAYACEYLAFILASAVILAARLWQRRYDLIYINNMPDILVASALLPKMWGAKVILDLHDPMPELMTTIFGKDPDSKSVQLIKWLEKWSMARADRLLTVNMACRRLFAARSCPPEKIGVVMNSPDGSIFPFRPACARPVPNGDGNRPFVVMYHGSLVERNGVDLAVEALARVRAKVPAAQLHIYGWATPFLEKVMQAARDRGLERSVRHLGLVPMEEIVNAIDACDVGIIPNHRNAFADISTPTRIFEYLALGKPVIAPRTPAIQDYFGEDSLLFFEAGNADELAERLEFVASNPSEALSVTERGQQVYQAHSWKQERQTLVSLVGQLLQADKSY
jgi:glycosyltransferase involved in cell wall biosynthesis